MKKISLRRKHQLRNDRATFRGMFERGVIYLDSKNPNISGGEIACITSRPNESIPNFNNPTPRMLEEAAKRGVDLKNPDVVKYLKHLQARNGGETSESARDNTKQEKRQGFINYTGKVQFAMTLVIAFLHYFLRNIRRETFPS